MAPNTYAVLHGMKVAIADLTGPFQQCRHCGGQSAIVNTSPSGFHAGELTCCDCGQHTSWLGRDHLAAMLAQRRVA